MIGLSTGLAGFAGLCILGIAAFLWYAAAKRYVLNSTPLDRNVTVPLLAFALQCTDGACYSTIAGDDTTTSQTRRRQAGCSRWCDRLAYQRRHLIGCSFSCPAEVAPWASTRSRTSV